MDTNRKRLKILFVSQYFPPEVAAPAVRVYETSREWVKLGHNVTVLCGFPHHPTGTVPKRYRDFLIKRENWDGIKVVRTWLYAAENKGVIRRSLSYISFMISAIISGLLFTRKFDVLIATSPQLLVGVAGWVLAKLKRCPFVFEVRDLLPEGFYTINILEHGSLPFRVLRMLVSFLYQKAQRLVVVSETQRDFIANEYRIPKEKIGLFPNGVSNWFFEIAEQNRKAQDGAVREVLYIGTLGFSQGLEVIIDAAERLPNVKFRLIGEGAAKRNLVRLISDRKLSNVAILPSVPRKQVPAEYASAQVALVTLGAGGSLKTALPSKMFEAMACGVPLVVVAEGEAARIGEYSGAAITVKPYDANGLAAAIQRLNDMLPRQKMSNRGVEFARNNMSRQTISLSYAEWLNHMVKG
ncbi:MAG: glycosyltransferase family 4 protein [Planctomycetota bacterium]|nr:glycosyltransferase family 4 protein [Planctomycetota bacterium]